MEAGFFYDGPITQNSAGDYYGVALNDNLFSRYFQFATKIHICMRLNHSDNISKKSKINMENMEFTECVNLLSLAGLFSEKKAEQVINSVLDKCECAIIRLPSRIGHLAVRCCEKRKIPYLIEMVGCPWDAFWNHGIQGKFVALPFTVQTKKDIYNAPAVIYVTKYFLQKRYPTQGINIGCSDVELKEVDDNVLCERLNRIRKTKSKTILGTAAAVDVKFKGQQYVIKALGYLKKMGITNYEYQIAGNGDQTYLKKIAKKYDVISQVKFLGGIPHDQIFNWLDNIDIYVQPSKQEGLPRSLVEAMSRGLPAFGARTGGIPELLDSEFIYKNNLKNVQQIAFLIKKFSKDNMEKQAIRNFKMASKYQKKLLMKKRIDFYDQYFLNKSKDSKSNGN